MIFDSRLSEYNILLDSLHLRIDNIGAMASTPLPLVVDNLSFRYRDRSGTAIHNILFTANPGEVLLITLGILILLASIVIGFMGFGSFWVPEALVQMF